MNKDNLLTNISTKQVLTMFNLLPEVLFWIKDTDCCLVYANESYLESLGLKNLEQITGKSDYDFSPKHIAKQFMVDDKKVMAGEVVTDRLEMNIANDGELAWYLTSKKPLHNEHGDIIGSYGVTRHLQKSSKAISGVSELKAPLNYIRQFYKEEVTVERLAAAAHLSISALERRFKKYLSKTPKQFIREFRLEKARKLLIETQLPIAEIAFQCGFSDHSYFSRHFKLMFHEMPSKVRLENK
ncbi:MAG: helix-turn-helix domain-containing protein [Thalassotalea sp.]